MATAKLLYRRLDSLFAALNPRLSQDKAVQSFLEDAFQALREDLRLRAGLLYAERREGYRLSTSVGEPGTPVAERLDPARPPLSLVLQHRVYIFGNPDEESSPARLGLFPGGASAGLVVGRRGGRYALFFLLDEGWVLEELDFALNTVHVALGSRLVDARVRGSFREAAEIQQSLLLEEAPRFSGFEIACRSIPAEEVGGDFYDFYSFNGEILGLAIGDASGHGLPAALVVRDVVTGLRMGIEKDLKVAYVFAKLNRVIHRSNLSSRFVSVFYGELESDGTLIYINAGHQPPLIFSGERVIELRTGGTVIGPLPEAQFQRGVAHLRKGDTLVLCTDGILERRDARGEFFGEERLRGLVQDGSGATAGHVLDRLFAAAFDFGEGRPWEDDATIVVVRRVD